MSTAAIVAATAGAGLASSAISAHAAGSAAKTQSNAALSAAQIQADQDQKALDFEKGIYSNQQSELSPYLNVGYGGLANLAYLAGVLPMSSNGTPGGTASGTPPGVTSGTAGTAGTVPQGNAPIGANPHAMDGTASTATSTPFGTVNLPNAGGVPTPGASGIQVPNGYPGLQSLVNTNLGGYGSLLKPFNGVVDEQNDPGYQFRLNQGTSQLQNSAAARGNLLSGNTLQALNQFNQDYASNEYQNTFNRYYTQQNNTWDKLAQLAGIGQSATGQSNAAGTAAANNTTGILTASGNQIGQDLNNAGAARASGYVGAGNAWANGISGTTNNLTNLYLLHQLGG